MSCDVLCSVDSVEEEVAAELKQLMDEVWVLGSLSHPSISRFCALCLDPPTIVMQVSFSAAARQRQLAKGLWVKSRLSAVLASKHRQLPDGGCRLWCCSCHGSRPSLFEQRGDDVCAGLVWLTVSLPCASAPSLSPAVLPAWQSV